MTESEGEDMEFSWIRYLLDNAVSGGSRVESNTGVHVAIHPYISWPVFNWAIVESLRSGDAEHALNEASNALASAGRGLSMLVPENEKWLESLVEARGLRPDEAHHVYWRGAAPTHDAAVSSPVAAGEAAEAHSWLELLLDGFEIPEEGRIGFRDAHFKVFGDPRAHLFEAVCDGQRAGASILWYDNDIAGMNTASVKPEWRRRGVHAALFAARMSRGMSLGAHYFATETAEPPVIRVAEKWGFKEGLRFRYWFR